MKWEVVAAVLPVVAPTGLLTIVLALGTATRDGSAGDSPALLDMDAAPPGVATPAQTPDARRGLAIFAEHCAGCHGPYGRGDGPLSSRLEVPARDLADPRVARTLVPAEAFAVITEGRLDRLMPPFGDSLSADERWDAVAAVMTMYLTPERLARSDLAFARLCEPCHSDDVAPALAGSEGLGRSAGLILGSLESDPHSSALADASPEAVGAAVDAAASLAFDPLPHADLRFEGVLRGTVRLLPDGGGVAGQPVRILPFAQSFPGDAVTVTTSANGEFAAAGLVQGPGVAFGLATEYESVDYTAVVTDTVASVPVEIAVYPTTETAALEAASAHVLLSADPANGVVQVVQIWSVHNPLSSTLIAGAGGSTLAFRLPEGAIGAHFGDPGRQASAVAGSDLTTASPVLPGAHEVSFQFALPYEDAELEWLLEVPFPVADVRIAAVGEGLQLEAGGAAATQGEAGGERVVGATLGSLGAGQQAGVRLSGLPPPAPSATAAGNQQVGGAGWSARLSAVAAVLGVLTAISFPQWGRGAAARRRAVRLRRERSAALDEVADLDRLAAQGIVDEIEHRRRRAAVLAVALRATRSLEQGVEQR